MKFWI
jgi:hypothetical protein